MSYNFQEEQNKKKKGKFQIKNNKKPNVEPEEERNYFAEATAKFVSEENSNEKGSKRRRRLV